MSGATKYVKLDDIRKFLATKGVSRTMAQILKEDPNMQVVTVGAMATPVPPGTKVSNKMSKAELSEVPKERQSCIRGVQLRSQSLRTKKSNRSSGLGNR